MRSAFELHSNISIFRNLTCGISSRICHVLNLNFKLQLISQAGQLAIVRKLLECRKFSVNFKTYIKAIWMVSVAGFTETDIVFGVVYLFHL